MTCTEIQHFAQSQSPSLSKLKAEESGLHYYSPRKQQQQQESQSYHNNNYSTSNGNGEPSASSSPCREMDLAVRLLEIPELSQIRFRLVPSRLKEDVFWQATFAWLKERVVEYNVKQQYLYETQEENESTPNGSHFNHINQNGGSRRRNGDSKIEQYTENLLKELQSKHEQIEALQQEIKELKQSMPQTPQCNGSNKPVSTPTPRHTGSWMMDRDSQEFLNYPAEVKESLRREKQKRLAQVQDEMKFILDSDEIHHTTGRWQCCGETKYHAHCSM